MTVLKKLVYLILIGVLSSVVLTLATIGVFESGILPEIEELAANDGFRLGYFGGIVWALLAGMLIGIVYIFIDGPKARWFLWAPAYVPALYMAAAIAHFS